MRPKLALGGNVVSRVVFSVLILAGFSPANSQTKFASKILFQDSVTVSVTNISIDGEFSFRGLTADFPYPVISTISIIDNRGNPIVGLADTLNWLGPEDITQIGLPVSSVWSPVLEYHLEDAGIPPEPDLYNQVPQPLFTEVRESSRLPTTTMLVMDASGSMTEEIADAKAGAILYVDQLRPVDQAGVVVFGTTIKAFQPLTDQPQQLRTTINGAQALGFTALYDAIQLAVQELKEKGGRQGIIVYTDGQDNQSVTDTPQSVIDSCRVHNIPVFTIALGDSTNEDNLVRVADETGGLFFKVATAEEMQAIYLKLSQLIQNYYLMAHASSDPIRNNTWRVVDVTMNAANFTGRGTGPYFVAAPPLPPATDLEVNLISVTDTSLVDSNLTTRNAVLPGSAYDYEIRIANLGPSKSDTVKLIHFLPDSVRFVAADPPPASVDNNLLNWEFVDFEASLDTTIRVSVAFSQDIPDDLSELPSLAVVSATNDTVLSNNSAADTVQIIRPVIRIPNYDLAITQTAITDTTVVISGDSVAATQPGKTYEYSIEVRNNGPGLANDYTIFDVIPDSVALSGFNIPPSLQTGNTAFWQLDSLPAGESITIAFSGRVSDSLQVFPFELLNISQVYAERDTNSANDSTATTVFAIPGSGVILPNTADVSVTQVVASDSFAVSNGDTIRYVRAGEDYRIAISVRNESQTYARNVRVVHTLADSARVLNPEPAPVIASQDSVVWIFPLVQPDGREQLSIDLQLAPAMPLGTNRLLHQTVVSATNEDPALPDNNTAIDTLFNITRPAGDVRPLIEASPPLIDIGDSVSVRVQIRVESSDWDLWVRFEDSAIDSSYADPFVTNNQTVLNQWMTIVPKFSGTRLTTSAEQEQITFEVRNRDILGTLRTATASVTIQSSNAMVLERNVFAASREDLFGINFKLSSNRDARLDLYDVAGSFVSTIMEAPFNAGWNTYNWNGMSQNGDKVGSGLYLITLRSGNYSAIKKVMVVR